MRSVSILLAFAGICISISINAAGLKKLRPLTDQDFYQRGKPPQAQVELGRMLFYDKLLSGNLNVSCASCHHALAGTGDGLSLGIGEGGRGLGVTRDTGTGSDAIHERVPRNAPPIFNLGAKQYTRMFHDGRVEVDKNQPSGFASPAGDSLPSGLSNVLAAQAMFPVTSGTEMAGQAGENSQADAAAVGTLAGPGGVWDLIADKLKLFPEYTTLFKKAFPAQVFTADDITFVLAANAIAAFESESWRFDNSPFDQWLRGDRLAMSAKARRGAFLFYGASGCSSCHSGVLQTDHGFHAIAMPQFGPGKGDNQFGFVDGADDFGRERVTGWIGDRYRFRTPSLRNVALTAPYGHNGAYDDLSSVVRHHLNPIAAFNKWGVNQARLPARSDLDARDLVVMNHPLRRAVIAQSNELQASRLHKRDFDAILTFLHALTDTAALDMRADVPSKVPSGLPIAE